MNIKKILVKIGWQRIIIIFMLIISAVAHGYNMFHFPYYENDEGTYISQAWSILKFGEFAPYTYWYDHAPLGWFLIALWAKLTGGFFTFGVSINTGRVLMLVLHVITTYLLIDIARRLSGGKLWPGIIAALVFSLSPLAIYFQRRVLLDNIMIFWIFLSFWLILAKIKLRYVYLSAVTFGIAVLTKENAVFFIPVFLYVIYNNSIKYNRHFALFNWLAISFSIISLYISYSLLKSEFFPPGFMGNDSPHVSLLQTWQLQFLKGSGAPFWDKNSDFFANLTQWLYKDAFVVIAGVISTILNSILAIKFKYFRIPAFFALVFWFFLIRGNLVIDFYIAPLVPLLAINIGMLIDLIARGTNIFIKKVGEYFVEKNFTTNFGYYLIIFTSLITIPYALLTNPMGQYTHDETTPQIDALNWTFKHVPKNSVMAIDDFAYVDFKENGYVNADWFWKIWYDPKIARKIGGWENIEYLFMTHEMLKQAGLKSPSEGFGSNMFSYYERLATLGPSGNTTINFAKRESTNGDWVAIYKRRPLDQIIITSSWLSYKKNYIKSYGQVVDPKTNQTTSEGQSYAMLRAVWEGDKPAFDGTWRWTQDHFQYRTQDKLFSWLWGEKNGKYQVIDSATASDADEDIALSLLFAYKRWGDISYYNAAIQIINDIWNQEVVNVNGRYYLTSGTSANLKDGYLINPSYFSPATYRIFAEVDPSHPWVELANDSYLTLNDISNAGLVNGNKPYLPPDWLLLDRNTGTLSSASSYKGQAADYYGFDAFRVTWRVALDAAWFGNSQAISYLEMLETFYREQWQQKGKFASVYNLDGTSISSYSKFSTDAGALIVFSETNSDLAKEVNKKIFMSKNSWTLSRDYYDQNWAWFATAFYNGSIKNLME